MKWDRIFINSVGSYLPQRFPVEGMDGEDTLERRHAGYETITKADLPQYVMAGIAASQAMERSSHCADTLSVIVLAMVTGATEHAAPVCHVQRILGQSEAIAFELNATSDGGVTGIEVVARILASDPDMEVGLVSSALRCPDEMDRWMAGALFGDGAAAAVISKRSGFARLIASHRISNPEFEMLLRPRVKGPNFWDFPDLDLNFGPYVETITQEVQSAISATLKEADITIDDISHFCLPVLPLVSTQTIYLERNNIPLEKTCWSELRKNGHVGPCDQILGLAHLHDTGLLESGQLVLVAGGGMGYRMTCLLLRIE
ncbi:ketoacyl-ACP synthase III family protein [Mycobacterium sp. 94-17]|uniref:ketoacyl-ACP synthase III family protein n=1 Tax=Mycobacterium sp. 94-17 TaxID=2986147 RepID=UPI002D1ED4C5|nr:ketoacyl-ACP synthase III family protein [Mycobacterium sp. 94-17]MEB4209439.1 ketoacyl-ACP synthase III family protein [Mycobacterium sp. 94-17]